MCGFYSLAETGASVRGVLAELIGIESALPGMLFRRSRKLSFGPTGKAPLDNTAHAGL